MTEMSERERFRAVMNFKKPDRLPWCEWSCNETTYRWIEEGLPISAILAQREDFDYSGSAPYSVTINDLRVGKYFGFRELWECSVVIDATPIPRYFTKTLEETDTHVIVRSPDGTTKKVIKGKFHMPMYLDWPVKTSKDWEQLKERLEPTDPRRYPKEWSDEYVAYLKGVDFPVSLWIGGFYGLGRSLMGTVPFLTAFYNDPELVRDMMEFQTTFILESIRKAVEALGSAIDIACFVEDFAYKNGPFVSPKLFRELILPGYKKVTSFLQKNGVDTIFVDTDGNPAVLIPLLLEGGVNGLLPLEVSAGVDAVALSKEYGTSLRLFGNIDKRVLARSKEEIRREVENKLTYLKDAGGFMPSVDHAIPPDIPLENFKYYANCIKEFL